MTTTTPYTIHSGAGVIAEFDGSIALHRVIRQAAEMGEGISIHSGATIRWASSDITTVLYPLTTDRARGALAKALQDAVDLGYRVDTADLHSFTALRAGRCTSARITECSWRKGAWRIDVDA